MLLLNSRSFPTVPHTRKSVCIGFLQLHLYAHGVAIHWQQHDEFQVHVLYDGVSLYLETIIK